MSCVSGKQLFIDMQANADAPAARTGFVPQARDRPPKADLLFYISGISMPMADFLRGHRLFIGGEGLNFDLSQFDAIRQMAQKVISERETGKRDGV